MAAVSFGPVNTLTVLSVLVAGKAGTEVRDAQSGKLEADETERAPRLGILTGSSRPDQAPV